MEEALDHNDVILEDVILEAVELEASFALAAASHEAWDKLEVAFGCSSSWVALGSVQAGADLGAQSSWVVLAISGAGHWDLD